MEAARAGLPPARVVRREHHGVPAPRTGPPARRRRGARHQHRARRSARPHRGARLPLQGGPRHAAPLHPRVPAGAHRGRRRRRRDPRGRVQARHDRRRHGLRLRRVPCAAARRSSCTPTATAARRAWNGCSSLGIDAVVFPATGTSEDVAMLLADDKGATLIAAVGTHVTLVEFLDKGRSGMASTFLTRLARRRQARRRQGRVPALPARASPTARSSSSCSPGCSPSSPRCWSPPPARRSWRSPAPASRTCGRALLGLLPGWGP